MNYCSWHCLFWCFQMMSICDYGRCIVCITVSRIEILFVHEKIWTLGMNCRYWLKTSRAYGGISLVICRSASHQQSTIGIRITCHTSIDRYTTSNIWCSRNIFVMFMIVIHEFWYEDTLHCNKIYNSCVFHKLSQNFCFLAVGLHLFYAPKSVSILITWLKSDPLRVITNETVLFLCVRLLITLEYRMVAWTQHGTLKNNSKILKYANMP